MKKALLIFVSVLAFVSVQASVKDSVGVEKKGSSYFVKHQMEPKETLYALSRKYNVTVAEIKGANPGVDINDIKIGQIILIPTKYKPATQTASASRGGTHKVKPKETLYGLSKMYNVSVEDLKKANPAIAEQGLQIGMELNIPGKSNATATSKPATTTPSTKVSNTTTNSKPQTTSNTTVKSEPIIRKSVPVQLPNRNGKVEKVNETGMAESADSRQDAPDFFAYHKTAPVGTIILVVNDKNNQKAYVRVIGSLKNESSEATLVQLSPMAMERIEAKGEKLKVSLSYFIP